jgi:hypothetical protein
MPSIHGTRVSHALIPPSTYFRWSRVFPALDLEHQRNVVVCKSTFSRLRRPNSTCCLTDPAVQTP